MSPEQMPMAGFFKILASVIIELFGIDRIFSAEYRDTQAILSLFIVIHCLLLGGGYKQIIGD